MGAKLYISRYMQTMRQVSKLPIFGNLTLKLPFLGPPPGTTPESNGIRLQRVRYCPVLIWVQTRVRSRS
jgi:hypothetical protein